MFLYGIEIVAITEYERIKTHSTYLRYFQICFLKFLEKSKTSSEYDYSGDCMLMKQKMSGIVFKERLMLARKSRALYISLSSNPLHNGGRQYKADQSSPPIGAQECADWTAFV